MEALFNLHKARRPSSVALFPVQFSILSLFIIHSAPYIGVDKFLLKVNFPLISLSYFSASGDYVVFSQKYLNRVQVYDSEARFISGFPLRGTASAFRVKIYEDEKIIDCTPVRSGDGVYHVYSLEGQRSEVEITESIISLCNNSEEGNYLSGGSKVTIERNYLGYRLHVSDSTKKAGWYSSQALIPYMIANILYLPVAVYISIALVLTNIFPWHGIRNWRRK